MFPHLRGDFWFPLTFVLVRIIYFGALLFDCIFYFPNSPSATEFFFSMVFVLHVYWIVKFFQGLQRRKLKTRNVLQEKESQQKGKENKKQQDIGSDKAASTYAGVGRVGHPHEEEVFVSSSISSRNGTFQLRARNTKDR